MFFFKSREFFYYTILANLFHDINVLAITSCDLRNPPSKSQSKDTISLKKSADYVVPLLLRESVVTTVNLSLSINDLNILDVRNMDMEMDLTMTQKWYDNRLSSDYKTRRLAVLGAIWQPKITFVVGSRCISHVLTTASNYNNDETKFWRGTSNGSVIYSERFLVKPKCTKDLKKYPFDTQTCFLKIGSYRFTAEEVSLNWSSILPIELRVKKELGEFLMEAYEIYSEIDSRNSENFSALVFQMNFSRYIGREVVQNFIPSIVLVKIAYSILWTKISDFRARIFTCQFSLIGIIALFTYSNHGLSNSDYFKAIDIWFFMCFVFVVLPLLESILIRCSDNLKENFKNEVDVEHEVTRSAENRKRAEKIDKILRVLHPIGLLCSSTLFFTVFKNMND